MAIKISELTPKGANLEATDLLEISQSTSDGYVSKSITGEEIINAIPVPELNPKTISSVNGTNLTGTAIQISASVLIPAGTILTNNTIYLKCLLTKTAGVTNSIPRLYINTSNSLTGATLLAAGQTMGTSVYFQRFERNIFFDGTNLNHLTNAGSNAIDLTSGAINLTAFNPATNYYLIFAVQNSSTTPDNLGWKRVIVQKYD
jgi:hypothetical protein